MVEQPSVTTVKFSFLNNPPATPETDTLEHAFSEMITPHSGWSPVKPHVADADFDRNIRIVTLYIEVIVGAVGGLSVFVWLWFNRRRRSRINSLIFNVAASDMLVICFATSMQLVWEYLDREWWAGDAACRMLKWAQSFSLMSSNNMLVVMSIDRHQAIRAPLRQPIPVLTMVSVGWSIAALLSLPQFIVFRQNFVTAKGPFENKTVCESIFREVPISHRQAYLTFISIVVFYIPLIIIVICYVRIFTKISAKTAEAMASRRPSGNQFHGSVTSGRSMSCRISSLTSSTRRSDKIHLQVSATSSSLPRAKAKTLKMTVVIVASFILCGIPYHIYEVILSYGDHTKLSPAAAALMGALPVANSVTNPYVFLAFNLTLPCVRRMMGRPPANSTVRSTPGPASTRARGSRVVRQGDMELAGGSSLQTEMTGMLKESVIEEGISGYPVVRWSNENSSSKVNDRLKCSTEESYCSKYS